MLNLRQTPGINPFNYRSVKRVLSRETLDQLKEKTANARAARKAAQVAARARQLADSRQRTCLCVQRRKQNAEEQLLVAEEQKAACKGALAKAAAIAAWASFFCFRFACISFFTAWNKPAFRSFPQRPTQVLRYVERWWSGIAPCIDAAGFLTLWCCLKGVILENMFLGLSSSISVCVCF